MRLEEYDGKESQGLKENFFGELQMLSFNFVLCKLRPRKHR